MAPTMSKAKASGGSLDLDAWSTQRNPLRSPETRMRKADIRFIKRVEIPNVELMHEYAGLLEPARKTGRERIMVVDG